MNKTTFNALILELVAKFREIKKGNIENTISTEATEVGILGQVYADPTLSTRKLDTMYDVSRRSIQQILEAHSFQPYKIYLVQELNVDNFYR